MRLGRQKSSVNEITARRDNKWSMCGGLVGGIFTGHSNTNEADNTAYGVSAAHTQSNPTTGDNLSDAVICAFLVSQPNSPQMSREDLEQIDPDDLEEMDLQWEMAMLTIRARRFIKRTGRQLDVNGQRVRFNRLKVECYNCHKYGHFAREYGIGGYDWSYQVKEEHLTNSALMAHTSSGSSFSLDSEVDSCFKSCVKAYANLKKQYDNLNSEYNKSQFNLVSYKAGLKSVEARLAHYKKNETVFEESINVLNLEVKLRDNALVENKKKLEKAEKERDELKLTLEKFQNSYKSLNNLLESQVIDKLKTRLGYNAASSTATSHAVESFVNSSKMLENQEYNKSKSDKGYHTVPPPYTGNFIPFKPDLTFMDEIVESENMDVITIVTHSNADNEFIPNVKDKTLRPRTEKIKFVKSARETVEKGNPQQKEYKENGVIDSGCSRHMNGNKCYHTEYEDYDGGFVSFGDGKGRISRKVDFLGYSWVFFLATKDETSRILKTFITEIENQLYHKVKVIRSNNGTEFKNSVMNQFCEIKGIKREFSVARTPQQNGVAKRKNRTLIEAARTMLVDSKLQPPFRLK
ncbi:ribonuclease H-like domain-containing protein [Tanacetum coccineum]|uniref:Ribonuclease H-like domain-containing protein n=1 Tax=Tanacetum coccineum TaxID=301880 RepID=A0ABQ4X5W7_9ASTR